MENNDFKNIENQQDDKIQIYENDDAYLIGNEISGSGEVIFKDKLNNINNSPNQDELLNKFNTNSSPEEEQDEQDQEQNNENKDDNNINVENSLKDKKYMINDMNSDIEQEENDNNNINNNINNENDVDLNNNNINNNAENDSNDSELPLVTLNFLSICQCCKNSFNSVDNIPYLLKCGHFFCKQCILNQFTDEEGIICPNDGYVANSISDLKILNNFITDKTVSQRTSTNCLVTSSQTQMQNNFTNSNNNMINNNNNYINNIQCKTCEIHKGQKLTHFIEETKELICVYCAFERFKQNQGIEIKEIVDKCREMEQEMESIIEENQYNVGIIQASLKEIKKNKENEEKKINEIFDKLIDVVKLKRDEHLNKIDNLFTNNAGKLSQKLDLFSFKIEKSEDIKEKIKIFLNNEDNNKFIQLLEYYNKIKNEVKLVQNLKLNLYKYKFCYDDEITVSKIVSKFGQIKLIPKAFTFMGNTLKEENKGNDLIINENMKGINDKDNYTSNDFNYETENNFKNYNFIDNINSIKNKNNSSTNFFKRKINSCNNTINNNKINKIINNNINRNLKLKAYDNNKLISPEYINNTFTDTHKMNKNNINYTQILNGGYRLNSPHSLHHNAYNKCRNTNDNYANKYKMAMNNNNGKNLKNAKIKNNQYKQKYNQNINLMKYDEYPFC